MLGQELYLPALNPKHILAKVDARLVCFEHVEAEEKIDVTTLQVADIRTKLGYLLRRWRCEPP